MVLVETSLDKEFEVDQSAVEMSNVVFDETFLEHKENGSELNELSDMDLGETSLEVNPTKDIHLPVVDSYLSESEINNMSTIILADHTSAHLEYTQLTTENPSTSFSPLTIVDNTIIKERAVPYSGETSHSEDCVKNKLKTSLLWPKTPERKIKRTTERLPYVIPSSGWKKIYEDKEKAKLEKEKKKEENKAIKKLKAQANRKKIKVNKARKNSKKPLKSALCDKDEHSTKKNSIEITSIEEHSYEENFIPDHHSSISESHIRKLSFEETGMNKVTSVLNHCPPENNTIMNRGLCFICTNQFWLANFGIKCQKLGILNQSGASRDFLITILIRDILPGQKHVLGIYNISKESITEI
ncbi:hypothetical protein JTB14_020989 [Gonioctena quinquepunctata]|nr:hypothetical protein JTB14_020989 [Gonioctena quinquepunctata]